jgi:NTE family protein
MNRLKNANVLVTDGSTGIGLEPAPSVVGRDQAVPKVGLPRTPPKSHELSKTHRSQKRPAFDNIILLLQGGGALGAYQAGV